MNKLNKLQIALAGGVFLSGFFGVASLASASTLAISPTSNALTVGSTTTATIMLDTTGQAIYGVDIYSLHFNPAVLQVVDADGATAGIQIAPGTLMASTQYNSVNNAAGTIQFSQTPSTGASNFTGSGILATITFQAIASGTSNLTFDFTPGSTVDCNVAGLYTDLLTSVTNGVYTASPVLDTTPPTISSIVAGSITQTGATITWSTNENSDSQMDYGLTTAYGASTVLNPSLVINHSVALSGLTAGTLYHYRVKSRDAAGNLATSIDQTFTTQSAPDTTPPTISITNPSTSGQTFSGVMSVSAVASDPIIAGRVTSGLLSESLLIDGAVFASSSAGSLTANLDTTTLTNNTHTLLANAKDNAGNTATSSAVSIITFNLSNATRYPRGLSLSSLEGLSSIPAGTSITASVIAPTTQTILSTQSLSPSATGTYMVTFQPSFPQVVSIRVSASGYLSQLLTSIDTTVNSSVVLVVPQLLAGDFNNDNTVNSLDYSLMNSHWLQSFATADVNRDGLINSLDFAVLKNNFGKSGQ